MRVPRSAPLRSLAALSAMALVAGGCSDSSDGALAVIVIGEPSEPFATGNPLPMAARLVRAATTEGMVGLDAEGRIVPALADRWIVTDGGQSYIFRLRDGVWPDGSPITAEDARVALRQALAAVRRSPLGLDLSEIDEVRAMAGRVIEIRLKSPKPDLLQVLAQPELSLVHKRRGSGPMAMRREGDTAVLTPVEPGKRGLPAVADWERMFRPVHVRAMPASAAIAAFDAGKSDIVLGGRLAQFPLANVAGLSRGTIRLDPVRGLFGLAFLHDDGFLSTAENREAVAMAIDREALLTSFSVAGWTPSNRIVSPGTEGDLGTIGERWAELDLEQRRAEAARRVARWRAEHPETAALRIAMPEGPGADLLFNELRNALAAVGLGAVHVSHKSRAADLRLVDVVARYTRATWFLNQLSCTARQGLCNSVADARAAEARAATDAATRSALLAEAEAELTAANVFIPFGPPVRWSLVRATVTGYSANSWGFHPLVPLATRPTR
jgi:ABC-type transport system substrate-binding protein